MNNTPPEVIEKWRVEFEREIYPHFKMTDPAHNERRHNGKYWYEHMNVAWAAFCIARQSVSIELPEQSWSSEGPMNDMRNSTIEHCREVIEDQGYRVNN